MSDNKSLTLAFDITALRRLRNLDVVFTEGREFAENIGILSRLDPPVVSKFIRESDLEPDFRAGPGGVSTEVLVDTAEKFPTDRHLFIGTREDDRDMTEPANWEYQPVEEIAKEKEWRLQYAPKSRELTRTDHDDWP